MTFHDLIQGLIGLLSFIAALVMSSVGYQAQGWISAVALFFLTLILGGWLLILIDTLERIFHLRDRH